MKPSSFLSAAITLATLAGGLSPQVADAHGLMIQPKGRSSGTSSDQTGTKACDSDKPGTVTSYKSGEEIDVVWTRNNHKGGFIRFSMVPKNEVSASNFDKNTFFYTCRESNCSLKNCKSKFCGDDAGAGANGIKCQAKVKLPDYYKEGDYVLQWTWHSAGSSEGNIGWGTGNYRTCADIKLTTSGTGAKPSCPTFVGGDRVTQMESQPNDQCFYFDNNDISTKNVKFGDAEGREKYTYGKPKEIEKCSGGAGGGGAGGETTPGPSGNSTTTVPSDAPSTKKPKKTKTKAPVPSEDTNGADGDAAPGTVVPPTEEPYKQRSQE